MASLAKPGEQITGIVDGQIVPAMETPLSVFHVKLPAWQYWSGARLVNCPLVGKFGSPS